MSDRRWLGLALVAVINLVASGCGDAGSRWSNEARPTGELIGLPEFPRVVSDDATTTLPSGPLGRGALIISNRPALAPVLVLTDGRQFRLPAPPIGEGRQGSTRATLSPDGRWLGLRGTMTPLDTSYQLRELSSDRAITVHGKPLRWSPDGRFLIFTTDDEVDTDLTVVEPATGAVSKLGAGLYEDGLWLAGILPDGEPLFSVVRDQSMRLRGGGVETTVVFGAGDNHECWCPVGPLALAPDGRTISVMLEYERGLDRTGEKAPERTRRSVVFARIDRTRGDILHRIEIALAGPMDRLWLVSDTGPGLLILDDRSDGDRLLLLDILTGQLNLRTTLAPGLQAYAPGDIMQPPDG
jgi:hypothetical protein